MAFVPFPEDNQQLDFNRREIKVMALNFKENNSVHIIIVSPSRLWNYSETQEGILTAEIILKKSTSIRIVKQVDQHQGEHHLVPLQQYSTDMAMFQRIMTLVLFHY